MICIELLYRFDPIKKKQEEGEKKKKKSYL